MSSIAITTVNSLSSFSFTKSKWVNSLSPTPKFFDSHHRGKRKTNLILKVSNCLDINSSAASSPNLLKSHHQDIKPSSVSTSGLVSLRLKRLVSEFQSLPEPIDRVKRLLDYATVLPQLHESTRTPENRVAGCAAQVWLEVVIDEFERMQFRADSDSEITKGFCYCLIYLLDGASPAEVLQVKAEDLADMNVGLPVRSRVNSWNNVLVSMKERTKALIAETEEMPAVKQPSPSVVTNANGNAIAKGSCVKTEVGDHA